jgi:hypothetical protein
VITHLNLSAINALSGLVTLRPLGFLGTNLVAEINDNRFIM